jgi:dihydroorotase
MNYVIKNARAYIDGEFIETDIKVVDGLIYQIGDNLTSELVYDVKNEVVTPGFIDAHVHLREPGFEYKEDINTGTYSAIKGGYTHLMSMPNTSPVIDSVDKVRDFNQKVYDKGYCNVASFVSISVDQMGEELVDIDALAKEKIAGFSDDGRGVQNDDLMLAAMKQVKACDAIMSLHCEDEAELGDEMGSMNEGFVQSAFGEIGINNASEWKMIKRDTKLLEEVNCRYHVCHVSTFESLEVISDAKLKNLDVSCEVTPHHLILCDEDIVSLDTNFKMNPPLRSRVDQNALIKGLNDGLIDIIATDHAPHSVVEKARSFKTAPFGIIGLDMAFSLLYTKLVLTDKVKLETIIDAMTCKVATRFRIDDYGIKVGMTANLCVLDLNKAVMYTKDNVGSKSSNSPFLNQELLGCVTKTIVNGKLYDWSNDEK